MTNQNDGHSLVMLECDFYFFSPCVIANLWDVTDKDIDRFTEALIKKWDSAKTGSYVTEFFESSRQKCRLPALIGMAPAVYGIPLKIVQKKGS